MFYTAFYYFLIYLVCLATLWLCGYFIVSFFKKHIQAKGKFTLGFLSLLFGLITAVLVFSVIKAGGNTINIILPVIIGLLLYKNKLEFITHDARAEDSRQWKQLLLIALPAVVLPFIYFCFVQFKSGGYYFAALDNDNAFYGHLSEQLKETGLESRWQNYFGNNGTVYKPGPYHYFDLWLNAIILSIFPVKALPALYLLTYPILVCISGFGLLAIVEHLTRVKSRHLLLCFAVFLVGPVALLHGSDFNFNTHACETAIAHYGEKFAVYYPFLFFSLLLLINKKLNEALISLSLLAMVSVTTLPALLILILFLLIGCRKNTTFHVAGNTFKLLIIFFGFFLFYYLNTEALALPELASPAHADDGLNTKGLALRALNLILKGGYYFSCSYFYTLPLFIVYLQPYRFKHSKHLLVLASVPVAGLIAKAAFFSTSDSYQLFTNSLPLFHALVMVLILKLMLKEFKQRPVLYLVIALLALNATVKLYTSLKAYRAIQNTAGVSDDYMLSVTELGQLAPTGAKVAHFYTQEDFDKLMTTANANYLYHLAYTNFDALPVKLSCVSVSNFRSLLHDYAAYESLNKQEAYYRYFYQQINKAGQSPDRIKNSFMRQNGLNHLLLSPNAELPDFLKARVLKVISDSQTGIRFVALKP